MLVAAHRRTNLTMHQVAPVSGASHSAAGRIIGHLGPMLALQPRERFAQGTVLIVHDKPRQQVRARAGHAFARMKTCKVLHDCHRVGVLTVS